MAEPDGARGLLPRGLRGCLVGVGCLVALPVLYVLYLLLKIVVPLTLGYLFPWEPPVAEDAPRQAVLRVVAPEDATYRIEWGPDMSPPTTVGKVDPDVGYRDYPVRRAALDQGDIVITVYAGKNSSVGNNEIDIGAVLFVSGQYAQCDGGAGRVYITLFVDDELGGPLKRTTCGSHRWVPL